MPSPRPSDLNPASECDPRFKSGLYRGHYIQDGFRSAQEMTLFFADGKASGLGADPVGEFVVSGHYDLESGRVFLMKRYPGAHAVHYDASAELKNGIWGLWTIRASGGGRADGGGFQLWPVGGPGQGCSRDAHADQPVTNEIPVDWLEPVGV
ncbi:MAG: hypothetical protein IT438_04130 [Phycisphaerales bacterium]|nr:hypothetical protein [Phycisphaerales bacterium]